jgi:hypothetical protein
LKTESREAEIGTQWTPGIFRWAAKNDPLRSTNLVLIRLSSQPFRYCVAHRFAGVLLHPEHEATIKFEMITASGLKESTHILSVSICAVDTRIFGN